MLDNNSRVAVCLIGISYYDGLAGHKRNWKLCCDNIKRFFGDKVTYFLTTYGGASTELLNFYNPKSSLFLDIESSTQRKTYIKGLQLVDDSSFDFIISTRFDIIFKKNLEDFNINFKKFNILFREKGTWGVARTDGLVINFVTDNFFAFPVHHKKYFIEVIQGLEDSPYLKGSHNNAHPLPFMHHVYDGSVPKLHELVDVHFCSDQLENSHVDNSFYKLHRGV
jgi:hypothetical protein